MINFFHLDIFLPVMVSVIIHEIAHGYAAWRMGDDTALKAGRLSIKPWRHISIVGTLILPLALLFVSGGKVMFGWAKPVPVTHVWDREDGMFLVSVCGPVANLVLAYLCELSAAIVGTQSSAWEFLTFVSLVNCALCAFNLLPIPPLDGWHVAKYLCRRKDIIA